MLRRSERLASSSYYDSEGKPTISYKEVLYRISKRRRGRRVLKRETEENFNNNTDSPYDCPSRETRRGPTRFNLKIWGFCLLAFLLCFGLILVLQFKTRYQGVELFQDSRTKFEDLALFPDFKKKYECLKLFQEVKPTYEGLINSVKQLAALLQNPNKLQDGCQWPNIALESLGTRVVDWKSSNSYVNKAIKAPPQSPWIVIQGNSQLVPGRCWAFAGDRGHLFISLPPSDISHVTLGHISKTLSPTGSTGSAPKDFSVYGLETLDGAEILLGSFIYREDGGSRQTFKLRDHQTRFNFVKLKVESNWGYPKYTCLYNFEVHGKFPSGLEVVP